MRQILDKQSGCLRAGLDDGCKSTSTPGFKMLVEALKEDKALEDLTRFKPLAARPNYAQDRIDLQFADKEVCRFVSAPTEASEVALKRLGRYLLGHKRMIYTYPLQRAEGVDVTATPTGPAVLARGSRPAVDVS